MRFRLIAISLLSLTALFLSTRQEEVDYSELIASYFPELSSDLIVDTTPFFSRPLAEQKTLAHSISQYPKGFIVLGAKLPTSLHTLLQPLYEGGKSGAIEKLSGNNYVLVFGANNSISTTYNKPLPHTISYSFSGGRLGDNLLSYLHAKWLAYKYQLPLHYNPFPYSDRFALHVENPLPRPPEKILRSEKELLETTTPTCFVVPYFSECAFEFANVDPTEFEKGPQRLFQVDWKDAGFRQEMQRLLQPQIAVQTLDLPQDRITIAVHVRRGVKQKGGADSRTARRAFPLKFPPDSYYIEAIKHLSSFYKGRKLYVFLFTDYPQPQKILKKYQKVLDNPDILWATRASNTTEEALLSDFFSLPKFDCLILCHSNFSFIPAQLNPHAFVIFPEHSTTIRNIVTVDAIKLSFDGRH